VVAAVGLEAKQMLAGARNIEAIRPDEGWVIAIHRHQSRC